MSMKDKINEAANTTAGKVVTGAAAVATVGATMGAGHAILAAGAGAVIHAAAHKKDNKAK